MKRWRATDEDPVPVEVECEPGGYPNEDADGCTQYENTHFDSEDEAWDTCRLSAEAFVKMSVRAVAHAESELAKARADVAEAAKFMKAYLDGRDDRARR